MTRRGWGLFIAVSVLWGLPYFFIRIAVRELDPVSLVLGRTLPAAIILVPLAWRRGAFASLRGHYSGLLLYTVIEFGVPWYFMSSAEQHISSSLASLLICATPLVAIGVSKIIDRQLVIEKRRIAGLLLGSGGVVALVGLDASSDSVWWIAAMGIVVVGYALGPQIIARRLHSVQGLAVVAASVAVVAAIYAPLGIVRWPDRVSSSALLSVAALAILCTIVAFLLFFELIKEIGPSRSTVVTYLNTALAVALGVIFLDEPITAGITVGFPIIVMGSVLATARRR
ncbi:MAG: DMT family transporter [Acidobacteria bacterium]|nr:DMT family transporter [Acidobacteriota bacterium]